MRGRRNSRLRQKAGASYEPYTCQTAGPEVNLYRKADNI